jgi:beta-lactamase superfamily II metal-dependent hydrolase
MTLNEITLSTIRSGKGDCLHLRYNGCNLIIDSGPTSSAGTFRNLCETILANGDSLDALIITHYDDDHIGGILKAGDLGFRDVYFNAYDGVADNKNLSAVQNQRLFRLLPAANVHSIVLAGDVIEIGGAKLTVHAPTDIALSKAKTQMRNADVSLGVISDWGFSFDELMEKDYPISDSSISNQASIVFTFTYGGYKILFTGDAWDESIPAGSFDIVKLPHHGSARNVSDELLTRLDTDAFLICADGTSHPNKQTIAKLLKNKRKAIIYSNYDWW